MRRYYPMEFDDGVSLREVCRNGLAGLSLSRASHGRPICAYLFSASGLGVKVQCTMHDIGPRLEVGSLIFSKLETDGSSLATEDLPPCFRNALKLEKLLYVDEDTIVESGVVMTAPKGEELLIVSGAFPYTVETFVSTLVNQDFEPEYPIASYKREPLE